MEYIFDFTFSKAFFAFTLHPVGKLSFFISILDETGNYSWLKWEHVLENFGLIDRFLHLDIRLLESKMTKNTCFSDWKKKKKSTENDHLMVYQPKERQ